MKFKYVGDLPVKNVDLVLAGIFKPTDIIKKGTIFEIPDDNQDLIQRMQISGNYEVYKEFKKISKPKKEEKEDKEEK